MVSCPAAASGSKPSGAAKIMTKDESLGYLQNIAVSNGNLNLALLASKTRSAQVSEQQLETLLEITCLRGLVRHSEAIAISLGRNLTPSEGEILIPGSIIRGNPDAILRASEIAKRSLTEIEADALKFVQANCRWFP